MTGYGTTGLGPIAWASAIAIAACQAPSPAPLPPAPAVVQPTAPAPAAAPVQAAPAEPVRPQEQPPRPAPPELAPKPAEAPPLPPKGEELIRAFWRHVNAGRTGAAAAMLDPEAGAKALWQATLEGVGSAQVVGIDPFDRASWTAETELYRVTIRIAVKPDDPTNPPPIPHHGWEDGTNVRWMSIRQTGAKKRISGIATGP